MYRLKSWQNMLPHLILVSSLLAVYLRTSASGLTWANDGSDGGDLIAAAATGGVAHPTGYPLYLILARVFQLVPLGSLAFRTNLFSAIATALAAALVYELVRSLSTNSQEKSAWAVALAAGVAFGLAPLIWSQAVITEVYGLQSFLVALIIYLYVKPMQASPSAQRRLDRWRGLTLGLAMGNHIVTLLLIPAVLVIGSVRRRPTAEHGGLEKFKLDRAALLRQLGMFGAGVLIYLLIPLRAWSQPPVNWGNVVTPGRFWWLVSGELYQSYYLQFSPVEIWGRVQSCAALLLQQFGLPGVVLGLVGVIIYGTRSRLLLLTVWTAGVFTVFAIVYGSSDSYVYLIPVFLSFSIWIGSGIFGLSQQSVRLHPFLKIGFALLVIMYFAGHSVKQIDQVDASNDTRAESFGREVLAVAPENAILFAQGDRAVFTLWYFHFALGQRPDVAVLAVDLLHFDWYQENLRATYPALNIPTPFPFPETILSANPSRPVCYVEYFDAASIDCSPDAGPP